MVAEPLPHEPFDDAEPSSWSARPGGTRRADRQDRVVQSLARKVTRPCRRNGCPAPARASLLLDYAGKRVTLVSLLDEADPRFLEVCPAHAAGMDVPRGWELVDERDEVEEPTGPRTAREMGSSATVAVLAEALRRDEPPRPPVEVEDDVADDESVDQPPATGSADDLTVDERQLRLQDPAARHPRPVPAALED